MTIQHPQVPYGAVYFRKSNPPREDWERDYAQAARDGMNIFRNWFMWGNIEIAPGKYDWEDYDAQLELAAKYGIRIIISEMSKSIPEWAYRKYHYLLPINSQGAPVSSNMNPSCATGGFTGGGLCLDHDEAVELTGKFLTDLVQRYKDHPGMYGYDVANELHYGHDVCYCEATQAKFRDWLKEKYGNLSALNLAWRRYSFAEWEDVRAPLQTEPFPECEDWLEFRRINYYRQVQWRIDLIRRYDTRNLITSHGTASSLINLAAGGSDDWLGASMVESYGLTWVIARKGSEPWKQHHAIDLVRASSQGKPFWHAEMQGGPLWLQPQVIGRAKEDARIATADDVRLWNLTSLAGGARGVLYLRWRSLLDGPLFGAFGLYGNSGLPNRRSEAASRIAKWANDPANADLFQSRPIKGEIGLVVSPETQIFNHLLAQAGKGQFYTQCMWGAYQGFFDNHIQADWVHIDHIDEYDTLYFPYPIKLSSDKATLLAAWVKNGGTLICEGLPAYFGNHGHVGVLQPNYGLDEVFGAREDEAEFMPDISGELSFDWDGLRVGGGLFLQSYEPTSGTAVGQYDDSRTAVIEHKYGKGKTLLVGTFPSEAYGRNKDAGTRDYFRRILEWSGKEPQVKVEGENIRIRLQDGEGGRFLWAINHGVADADAVVDVSPTFGGLELERILWGETAVETAGNRIRLRVPAKDALVVKFK